MTDRANLLLLLNAARLAGRPDYIRHVAADWLGVWPGDREVARSLAAAETELGFDELASARLTSAVIADPEDQAACAALATSLRKQGKASQALAFECCARALRRAPCLRAPRHGPSHSGTRLRRCTPQKGIAPSRFS